MPDALSKTVPMWCAVINRAVKIAHSKPSEWNISLYCPPGVVSPQEHSQIESHVDEWARSLSVGRFKKEDPSCTNKQYCIEIVLFDTRPTATLEATVDNPVNNSISKTTAARKGAVHTCHMCFCIETDTRGHRTALSRIRICSRFWG